MMPKRQKTDGSPRALSSRATLALREAILEGHFLPGQRLTQEMLADFIGASRVPVREALNSLASEGLITLVENTGAWVTSYTQAQCVEVYRVRERIEPLLLELSMPHLSGDEIRHLAVLCDDINSTKDLNRVVALDREFHFLTYSGHREQFLHGTVEQLWNTTQHYRRLFIAREATQGRQYIAAEHSLLLDAITRGDIESASTVLGLHIRRTRIALSGAEDLFDAVSMKPEAPHMSHVRHE